jgi:hypothetical protein
MFGPRIARMSVGKGQKRVRRGELTGIIVGE